MHFAGLPCVTWPYLIRRAIRRMQSPCLELTVDNVAVDWTSADFRVVVVCRDAALLPDLHIVVSSYLFVTGIFQWTLQGEIRCSVPLKRHLKNKNDIFPKLRLSLKTFTQPAKAYSITKWWMYIYCHWLHSNYKLHLFSHTNTVLLRLRSYNLT